MKRFIVCAVVLISCLFPFSSFAVTDWASAYMNINDIQGMIATGVSGNKDVYSTSVTKGFFTSSDGSRGLNVSGHFDDLSFMFSRVLYTTSYGSKMLGMRDNYHYTVSLSLKYKFENAMQLVTSGHNFKFVLTSSLQTGHGEGNYFVSNSIAPSSSYVSGDYTYYVFDFDVSVGNDWPEGTVDSDGFLNFTGFGVVDTTDTLFGTYDVDVNMQNMRVKAYTPEEWQTYVTKNGFDNVSNEVVEGMKEYAEWERNEASNGGNSSVDSVANALQDNSSGLLESFSNLFSALSYEGTECSWTFPALTLPAIPHVMEEIKLSDPIPINFSQWVEKIPEQILQIVRALTTCALVLFCFKELWGVVEYVMVLRGGGSES